MNGKIVWETWINNLGWVVTYHGPIIHSQGAGLSRTCGLFMAWKYRVSSCTWANSLVTLICRKDSQVRANDKKVLYCDFIQWTASPHYLVRTPSTYFVIHLQIDKHKSKVDMAQSHLALQWPPKIAPRSIVQLTLVNLWQRDRYPGLDERFWCSNFSLFPCCSSWYC